MQNIQQQAMAMKWIIERAEFVMQVRRIPPKCVINHKTESVCLSGEWVVRETSIYICVYAQNTQLLTE